ncbi:MFS transporter [Rhodococcus sp. KBW08]|uniref:MFS transporter n=1 Tax=Rhodococcus sp. KBW08 TaxID=2144188 RepID=UPI001623EAB9|nr:MFS transporter [Rhodococcus sp. KBW08]
MSKSNRRTGQIIFLLVCVVVVMTQSNMPTPLYSEFGRKFSIDTFDITVIYAMYALGVALALVAGPSLAGRIGERNLIIAALVGVVGANLLFVAAHAIGELVAARVLTGIAAGVVMSVGTATIVELADPRARSFYALLATACNILGMGIGPVLGGLAVTFLPHPIEWVFFTHMALTTVLALCAAVLPRDVSEKETPTGKFVAPSPPADPHFRRGFAGLCLIGVAGMGVLGLLAGLTPTFLHSIDPSTSYAVSGLVIGSVFAGSAVAQLLLKRVPDAMGLSLGTAGIVLGLGLFSAAVAVGNLALFTVAATLCGLGQGLTIGRSVQVTSAHTTSARDRIGSIALFYLALYAGASVPVIAVGVLQRHIGLLSSAIIFTTFAALVSAFGLVTFLKCIRAYESASNRPARTATGQKG